MSKARVEAWASRGARASKVLALPRPQLWIDGDGGRVEAHVGVFIAAGTMDPLGDVGVTVRVRPGSLIFRLIVWLDRRGWGR